MSGVPPNRVFYNGDNAEPQPHAKPVPATSTYDRSKAGSLWTLEERMQLKDRLESGMSLADIANAHGRSAGAILGKLMEHRLLVQDRNGFYYKVSPDAWCSYHDARHADAGGPA